MFDNKNCVASNDSIVFHSRHLKHNRTICGCYTSDGVGSKSVKRFHIKILNRCFVDFDFENNENDDDDET